MISHTKGVRKMIYDIGRRAPRVSGDVFSNLHLQSLESCAFL